ncbi:uncharacterized protein LOC119832948 [Zerene cesonia]|uniref:uncharacterized protein LOC119832948 n=1 Tax=Zerene cesonia TaxID=33412 RepID=UPI0018E51666|nr:uncharacterized protein LOC119832948 [Zerene cesonia]
MNADPEAITETGGSYALKIFQTCSNLLVHLLIGIVVGTCLHFSFSNGLPLGATAIHIVLCAIGYQLLMAQAILMLSPENAWSKVLTFRDKRRAHTILQISGSALAIAGSIIKMLDKNQNFNTLHGQFGLAAMVFTTVSLVNGVTSLYAFEWRAFCPGNISKITHILFGSVAFICASICLCYGIDKNFFRMWTGQAFADTLIAFIAIFTVIIVIAPFVNCFKKTVRFIKK